MLSNVVQENSNKPFIRLKDFVNLRKLLRVDNYYYKLTTSDIKYMCDDKIVTDLDDYKFYEEDFINIDTKGNKTFHYPSLFIKLFGGKYIALDSSLYIDKGYIEDLFRIKKLKQLKENHQVVYTAGEILRLFEERQSLFI